MAFIFREAKDLPKKYDEKKHYSTYFGDKFYKYENPEDFNEDLMKASKLYRIGPQWRSEEGVRNLIKRHERIQNILDGLDDKYEDEYINLEDLKDEEIKPPKDAVTIAKIKNGEVVCSGLTQPARYEYLPDEEEYEYFSNQFSDLYPLQKKFYKPNTFLDLGDQLNPAKMRRDRLYGVGGEYTTTNLDANIEDDHKKTDSLVIRKKERKRIDVKKFKGVVENIPDYLPSKLQYPILDIERDILDDFTITVMGRRRSGKTFFVRWLLYHLRFRIPCFIVITGTKLNNYWAQYIPDEFIFDISEMNKVICYVFERQKFLLAHPELGIDPRIGLILDDVMKDKYKVRASAELSSCFTDGRHYKIMLIITAQDPRGIPPDLRENTDLAVIFRMLQRGRKEAVAEDFLDYIEDKEDRFEFIWEQTRNIDLDGNVLDVSTGDITKEIPQAFGVLQAKHSNNIYDVFKKIIAHDPGEFVLGDERFWKAMKDGNWKSLRDTFREYKRK